ncbi:non-homologous end-joining DNA ligase [Allorhizocola rhizosphaerae]|uniref:non-homologous end-joining DNA ligase n=1 Tax=Allorhizocola rhizosphaerae TaxID=1872709 RepID=UPI001FE6D4A9|nr:non-homologous end-joining DNA ligase [Allorhizocola rhizosphaerae]
MVPLFRPMLATLGKLPTGPRWSFEFKWDGVRAIVGVTPDSVRAMSRNDIDITPSYPELLGLPAQLGKRQVVLDGELVTLDKRGAPSFGLLQQRMHVRRPDPSLVARFPVLYYVFDLLWMDGETLTGWSYARRRAALEKLRLRGTSPMSVPPRFPGPGQDVLEAAGANGLEGVIAKSTESVYEPGRRSLAWIKTPFNQTQEVIVVGWKAGAGRREGMIGSLLLAAYNEKGKLDFLGHVGTGFTDAALVDLSKRLAPLKRATSPVDGAEVPREHARHANWVRPVLVGEVEFRSWTPDGRIRHAAWRGVRMDKNPKEVLRPSLPL